MPLSDSLAARITAGDLAAMLAATSRASARNWSRGTTASTDPKWCSSAAVAVAEVYTMARILCCGTRRDRWVAAPRAPRSTSGSPKEASSEAMMTSALPTRPIPPPRQKPWTAAMTGTSQS